MNVKIGFTESPRELIIPIAEEREAFVERIRGLLAEGKGLLEISDDKGRTYLINAGEVAYVEVGAKEQHSVGFAGV